MRGAPISPREPPATSTWPLVNFVHGASLRGSRSSTDGSISPIVASAGPPRNPDVENPDQARMSLAGRDPQARLGRVERDGGRGPHRDGANGSGGGVDAAGHIDAHDGRAGAVDGLDRLGDRAAGLALEPRSEQGIDQHGRTPRDPCRAPLRPLPRPRSHPPSPIRSAAPADRPAGGRDWCAHRPSAPAAVLRTPPLRAGRPRAAGARRPARRRRCCPCRTRPPRVRPARAARRSPRDARAGALHQIEPVDPLLLDRPAVDRAHRVGVEQRHEPVGKGLHSCDARWSACSRARAWPLRCRRWCAIHSAPRRSAAGYSTVTVFARLRG